MLSSTVFAADAEYAQERVVELPQDQGMWYVSLFGDSTDPQYRKLQQWFQADKGLASLRGQVHYNEYTIDTARFQRYAESLPSLPCLRIQNSQGTVISEFWSDYIPKSSALLYQGIAEDLQGKASFRFVIHHRRYHCPDRQVEPLPATPSQPAPILDTPPVIDEPEPKKPGIPWLLVGLAIVVGAGVGVANGYKKEHIDQPKAVQKGI